MIVSHVSYFAIFYVGYMVVPHVPNFPIRYVGNMVMPHVLYFAICYVGYMVVPHVPYFAIRYVGYMVMPHVLYFAIRYVGLCDCAIRSIICSTLCRDIWLCRTFRTSQYSYQMCVLYFSHTLKYINYIQ